MLFFGISLIMKEKSNASALCDKGKLSTRGRCSCCSRPKVALLAAEGSVTRGRESMTCKALREKALGRGEIKKSLCAVLSQIASGEACAHDK